MSERVYCSEHSAHEPMIGTADQVDVWVLLEYRPAWKARAVDDSNLGSRTRRWLEDNLAELEAAGLKARPQLIRRPEIDRDEVTLMVGVRGALLRFGGIGYDFLADVRLAEAVAAPERFATVSEPQYFVCTNGQRDLCCARFGLPVYAALREVVGERAWQVTHLGGHRFAPNVLALPQGALYGRVRDDDVAALVTRVESGELCFSHLRGRAWHPPVVQAAEALCARSDLELVAIDEGEHESRVRFDSGDGARTVQVRRAAEPVEVLKSCGDAGPKTVWPFVIG